MNFKDMDPEKRSELARRGAEQSALSRKLQKVEADDVMAEMILDLTKRVKSLDMGQLTLNGSATRSAVQEFKTLVDALVTLRSAIFDKEVHIEKAQFNWNDFRNTIQNAANPQIIDAEAKVHEGPVDSP